MILVFSNGTSLRSKLKESGLQQQLPSDHILTTMYFDVMSVSHPLQKDAVKNYRSTVGRTLRYVENNLKRTLNPPKHWSDLLIHPETITEYLDR